MSRTAEARRRHNNRGIMDDQSKTEAVIKTRYRDGETDETLWQ